MSRVTIALIAGLLLSLCGLAVALDSRAQWKAQADALETRAVAAEALTARVRVQIATVQRQRETAQKELQDVLQANPAWSAEPAPAAVADGLCKHLRCK